MSTTVETVRALIVGDSSSFVKAALAGSSSMDRFCMKMQAASKQMVKFGAVLSASVTLPLTLLAKKGGSQMISFGSAMNQSLAIMSGVSASMRAEMEKTAKSISTSLPISATEAAKAYFYLASAGKNAKQSLMLMPKVANFATAGMFDMATATDLLTDAQSALGMTSKNAMQDMKNMTMLGDMLVKANTLANASVRQFSEALTNDAATAMKGLNIPMSEGIALLAAYADQGKKGAEGGTLMGRAIRLLAASAEKNSEAFKSMGINVFNAQGKLRSMPAIFKDMDKALVGLTPKMRIKALDSLGFETLAQKSITPLLGMSDAIARYTGELNKAGGATETLAKKQLNDLGAQLKILKNQWDNTLGELMDTIKPFLLNAVAAMQKMLSKFNALPKSVKLAIVAIGGVAAVAGPLLVAGGTLGLIIAKVVAFLPVITAGLNIFMTSLPSMSGLLAMIAKGAVAALVGLAKFAIIGAAIYVAFKLVTETVKALWEAFEMDKVMKDLGKFFGFSMKLNMPWKELLLTFKIFMVEFDAGIKTVAAIIAGFAKINATVWANIMTNIGNVFAWIWDNWDKLWAHSWDIIKAFAMDAADLYSKLGIQIVKALAGLPADFSSVFDGLGKNLEREFGQMNLTKLVQLDIMDGVDAEITKAAKKIVGIDKAAKQTIEGISKAALKVPRKNRNGDSNWGSLIGDKFGGFDSIYAGISDAVSALGNLGSVNVATTFKPPRLAGAAMKGTADAIKAENRSMAGLNKIQKSVRKIEESVTSKPKQTIVIEPV